MAIKIKHHSKAKIILMKSNDMAQIVRNENFK